MYDHLFLLCKSVLTSVFFFFSFSLSFPSLFLPVKGSSTEAADIFAQDLANHVGIAIPDFRILKLGEEEYKVSTVFITVSTICSISVYIYYLYCFVFIFYYSWVTVLLTEAA